MSRSLIGLCFALLFTVFFLAMAPARLLSAFVPGEQLLLQGVSGTLWQGTASQALVASSNGYLHLGRLHWTLSPLSLLTLSPRVELDSQWGNQRLKGEVVYHTADSFQLSAVDALIPAALVKQFVPLELSGNLALQLQELVVEGGLPVEGSGRAVWLDGGWLSPQGRHPLGSYAIDFEQLPGQPLIGEILTLDGELEASGSLSLAGRDYQLDMRLSGPGLSDPRLRQALQLVAVPEGDAFRIKMQGTF